MYKGKFIVILFFFNILLYPLNSKTDPNNDICVSQNIIKHSGGTDKCGCHVNRKTGEYHCHTRKQRGGDCPP